MRKIFRIFLSILIIINMIYLGIANVSSTVLAEGESIARVEPVAEVNPVAKAEQPVVEENSIDKAEQPVAKAISVDKAEQPVAKEESDSKSKANEGTESTTGSRSNVGVGPIVKIESISNVGNIDKKSKDSPPFYKGISVNSEYTGENLSVTRTTGKNYKDVCWNLKFYCAESLPNNWKHLVFKYNNLSDSNLILSKYYSIDDKVSVYAKPKGIQDKIPLDDKAYEVENNGSQLSIRIDLNKVNESIKNDISNEKGILFVAEIHTVFKNSIDTSEFKNDISKESTKLQINNFEIYHDNNEEIKTSKDSTPSEYVFGAVRIKLDLKKAKKDNSEVKYYLKEAKKTLDNISSNNTESNKEKRTSDSLSSETVDNNIDDNRGINDNYTMEKYNPDSDGYDDIIGLACTNFTQKYSESPYNDERLADKTVGPKSYELISCIGDKEVSVVNLGKIDENTYKDSIDSLSKGENRYVISERKRVPRSLNTENPTDGEEDSGIDVQEKMVMPLTGGEGKLVFIVAGLVFILFALALYRTRKNIDDINS